MDMREIDNEIIRLENMDATYDILTKLAVLYSIKDHHTEKKAVYSHASSEFINVLSGADWDQALEVLDEHMDAIKILHPREYTALINRLRQLNK